MFKVSKRMYYTIWGIVCVLCLLIFFAPLPACKPACDPKDPTCSLHTNNSNKDVTSWRTTWWDGQTHRSWVTQKSPSCYSDSERCTVYLDNGKSLEVIGFILIEPM